MRSSNEELANMISHGIGLIAALIAAPILLLAARNTDRGGFFVGTIVFIATMLALYLASTLYHAWPETRTKCALQLLESLYDFFLDRGDLRAIRPWSASRHLGSTILGVVWAVAVFGVIVKAMRGTSRHRKLAMSLYLGLGWSALIIIWPLTLKVRPTALFWLFAGGVAYTAGVLFFINKRLRYSHFVSHLFVLLGTSCHFVAMLACATN